MKNKFIEAYVYCYGTTKAKAEQVYKENKNNIEYISTIINSFYTDAKKSFYSD